jgi:hypothetical protein
VFVALVEVALVETLLVGRRRCLARLARLA